MILREWIFSLWIAVVLTERVFSSRPIVKLKFETQPTSNIIISEGSNASLPCHAKSTGGHVIYDWFINGSMLSTSSNHSYRYITNDYGLVIVNVQRHIDDGLYRCIATNDLGSILSNQALLQVAYFDTFNDSCRGVKLQVTKFESMILRPPKVSSFPKGRVTWFSGRNIVQDGDSQNYITADGSLNLIGIDKSISYRCIVNNSLVGLYCIKSYAISVDKPPMNNHNVTMMASPSNHTVPAGTSLVVFECIFSLGITNKDPKPAGIKWYKDNVLLKNIVDSSKYGFIQNSSSLPNKLLVYNIEMNDEGVYKCTVTTITHAVEREAILKVTKMIDPPPTCTNHLSPVLTALEGDTEEIDCPVDDDDHTVCIWYKNAMPVPRINTGHVYQDNGTLVFDYMMVQNTGLYQVMLKNNGGECMSEIPIYVKVQVLTTTARPTTLSPTTTTTISSTTTPTTNPPTSTRNTGTVLIKTVGTTDRVTTSVMVMSDVATNRQSQNIEDFLIYIVSGCAGFVALATVVILAICCSVKKRRTRKRNVNGDLEMNPTKRPMKSLNGDIANLQSSPGMKRGVDTKRLLNDEEDALYAPVLALENASCIIENNTPLLVYHGNRKTDHKYEEPMKSQRKPYNKPLPTLPRFDEPQPRPPSRYSYLELLGPTQSELQAIQAKENEANKHGEVNDESMYDCAREGVLTNTLKRITNQEPTIISQPISIEQQPIYQVLEKDIDACVNRDSTLYATADDVLKDSEPVYHVLEPTRPESVYQSLVDYTASPSPTEQQTRDNIYQPLDKKARSTSVPSSSLLKNTMKEKRSLTSHVSNDVTNGPYSQSCPEYVSDYNSYMDSDDLYQPLNNNQRCPLNVSKPKNTTIPRPARLQERRGSVPIVTNEPTLHAIDVSPRGSLKENEKKKKRGHRRHLSDTHTIVNISRLTQRRASAGEILISQPPLPGLRKRNHSDFGLCPIDLSLLRVSIDFENYGKTLAQNSGKDNTGDVGEFARDDGKSGEPLYMPLMKSLVSIAVDQETMYSFLNETSSTK